MLALIIVSVAHFRALDYLIISSCVHIVKIPELFLRVVKELSLWKRSNKISKGVFLSLGMRS